MDPEEIKLGRKEGLVKMGQEGFSRESIQSLRLKTTKERNNKEEIQPSRRRIKSR